ncbi:MAG TPA: hypothetical protein PLD25_21965 [Chloroflexota bacterium]|nr:hypothetical protein [Chloroflexota bacterium]
MQSKKPGQIIILILGTLLLSMLALMGQPGADAAAHAAANQGEHHTFLPIVMRPTDNTPGSGAFRIYAYSDAAVLMPNEFLQPQIAAQKEMLCGTAVPPHTLSLAQAVQNGWNYLAQQVGAANLATFRNAPEVATADAAQAFAMAAMIDNRPDGALAGLLLAHERAPQSRIILINAAGMFVSLDMPNEALALLNAAQNLPDDQATPMGIPAAELAANTRGYALLRQGQWAAAEAVLRPLVEAETELAEARLNLSLALLCQHKDEQATYFYRAGSRRQLRDEVRDGEEIEGIRLPPEQTLNRAAGQLFILPPLGVMNTPGQAQSAANHYHALVMDSIQRSGIRQQLIDANIEARSARPLPGPLTWQRFNNIYITANRAEYEPDIQALYLEVAAQEETIAELIDQQDEEFLELYELYPDPDAFIGACRSTVTQQLAEMLPEYFEYEDLLAEYTTAKFAAMTGTAANLSDVLNHEYVSLLIEDSMETDVAWRLNVIWSQANRTAANWAICEGAEENIVTPPSEPTYTRAPRCPASLTRGKMAIKFLNMIQIKANCEVFEVEVSGPTLLTIFGQVTVNFQNKTTTFFAGGKINAPGGLGELAISEGFYVKTGAEGVTDVGMKVGSSVDVGVGQFAGVVDGPEMEFGVAPAVEYLGTLYAP